MQERMGAPARINRTTLRLVVAIALAAKARIVVAAKREDAATRANRAVAIRSQAHERQMGMAYGTAITASPFSRIFINAGSQSFNADS